MWGEYDGIGGPIELSYRDYEARFVYSQDFANAEQAGYNQTLGQGSVPDNSREYYPDGIVVEYHVPGFDPQDPQYGGLDWKSLRLVFEPVGDMWYLVGVIHAEWTT